jgi:hypothetical protein
MAQFEEVLPSPPQRFGCMDPQASNYDSTATLPCFDCCEYVVRDIIGCTDRLASNYNPNATTSCKDCCAYKVGTGDLLGDDPVGGGDDDLPTGNFPYDLSLEGDKNPCISDTGYNESWTYTEGENTFYGTGFKQYYKDFTQITQTYVPNGFNSFTEIDNAFNVLLLNRPNSRIFINSIDLTPWIIPLYAEIKPITPNPNIERFKNECVNIMGGTVYTYEEVSDIKLQNAELELSETKIIYEQQESDFTNYQLWIDSLKREPTETELAELNRLKNLVTQTGKILSELESTVKILSQEIPDTSYLTSHFMACLCESVEPIKCKTTDVRGNSVSITLSEGADGQGARCITTYEDYLQILKNQLTLGWNTVDQTTFFNVFLIQSLGISLVNAQFVVDNIENTTISTYPEGTMTGAARAKLIVSNAFNAGANLWIPLNPSIATDVIHEKECCDLVGGIYQEGTYNNVRLSDTGTPIKAGVCLCKEIKEPCPTISDGTAIPISEVIETKEGTIIQTYIDVSEECCSNESLQSRLPGNWTWDPITRRCILVEETDECNTTTTITISETPISSRGLECIEDTITITAYMYFEEPSNLCSGGVPNNGRKPLTDEMIGLYNNPPQTTEEISQFSKATYSSNIDGDDRSTNIRPQITGPTSTEDPNNSKCCYDTDNPIEGRLVILDDNNNQLITNGVTYVDTFLSQITTLNTNTNVGVGFDKWVKLTTTVSTATLGGTPFNVAVQFPTGLFKCCDYDIYFDDLEVGCLQPGVRQLHNTEKCPGFDIRHVIDNKKSWVYNPGKESISDDVMDNIIRQHGTRGMNIAQSNPHIIDGGHGAINRVFAPSVDAELPFRDTDYFGFHGVIERHSKLVLNSKEVILQFNMCADNDCLINPQFLIDDYGNYVLDDDGGRIIVGPYTPFPNLVQLERFKKTFQGFWVQFMEQFIPATTIFVSGEKWCNSRVCSEMIVADYLLDATNDDGVLSPPPISTNIEETPNPTPPNVRSQLTPITEPFGEIPNTPTIGDTGSSGDDEIGPIIVGPIKIYDIPSLTPYLGVERRRPIT